MMVPSAIGRARVPQHLADAGRLRQGLENWLGGCDPSRHGLPGDAIVLLRRLATPWRALLDPDPARRYAPFSALLAGAQRALTEQADAEVVWFADEAELLACIARDGLSGQLADRWWWRTLQRGLPAGQTTNPACGLWLASPRVVPQALQRLGAARALAWLQRLGDSGQVELLEALASVYGLAPQIRAWVRDGRLPAGVEQTGPDLSATLQRSAAPPAQASSAAGGRADRLQRLCTALARDPAAANHPQAWRAWVQPLAGPQPAPQLRPVTTPSRRPATPCLPAAEQTAAALPAAARPDTAPAAADTASLLPEPAPAQPQPPFLPGAASRQRWPGAVATAINNPGHVTPAGAAPAPARPALLLPATSTAPARFDPALAEAPAPTLLHTRHGGLLFLLNAALQLALYGDFTQPRHRGLDCPPWRFLLLAGRAWCGPGLRRDPLWAWLLQRAGGARQPVPWQIWPEMHARLLLALAEGQGTHPALGDGQAPRLALRTMLGMPARLRDTGERLDLFFSLTELPLAVRRAGLDRDPGWIPAAGCDVRFHFD